MQCSDRVFVEHCSTPSLVPTRLTVPAKAGAAVGREEWRAGRGCLPGALAPMQYLNSCLLVDRPGRIAGAPGSISVSTSPVQPPALEMQHASVCRTGPAQDEPSQETSPVLLPRLRLMPDSPPGFSLCYTLEEGDAGAMGRLDMQSKMHPAIHLWSRFSSS